MKLPDTSNKDIFHAYDVRGIYPDQLSAAVAYKIAQAYFEIVPGEKFVIGFDMRESSSELFQGFVRAANDVGKIIDSVGMVSTDMIYFAVGKFDYDGGIMITASHNPKKWNGFKLSRKGVLPIHREEIKASYDRNSTKPPRNLLSKPAEFNEVNYDEEYVDHVLSFVDVDKIKAQKIVIDAGNGLGGIMAKKVMARLPQISVTEMYYEPNANFPHHEANPGREKNTHELAQQVSHVEASLGIAFDGDADRCAFVDEQSNFVPGDLVVALLTRKFLEKEKNASIVFDYRNTFAIQHEIYVHQGNAVQVKAGHSFFKDAMRNSNAVFGGEGSSHFFFRDNYFADNGIIPMLLVLEYLSELDQTLSQAVHYYREEYFSSGEHNFILNENVDPNEIYQRLEQKFHARDVSHPDGLVLDFDGWRLNARMSNTEPKMRVMVEAHSQSQIDKAVLIVHEILSEYAVYQGDQSMDNIGISTEDKFYKLMSNIWFTWNPHYILPIIDLYGDGWRKNPPPSDFTSQFGKKYVETVLDRKEWEIDQNLRLFRDYINDDDTWFDRFCQTRKGKKCQSLNEKPIAYFSLEYGLVDWLQIYSGGLGVLAGDFIKQASDMGIPMVAMGLFYHQGYFHQDIDEEGIQHETYIHQNPEEYPLELMKDENGNPIEISIEIVDHEVWVRIWKMSVGKTSLYLLDTNIDRNQSQDDRMITAHLYGGGQDTRIRQEILLGIGGPRALKAMGIEPSLYHMNEGHSGFLVLEMARRHIEERGLSFEDAIKLVDDHLVFTNHTLKQAGNDIFPYPLIEKYFNTYLDNLNTDLNNVYELGKDQLYAQGQFSMTLLGLRNAIKSNAVSQLHGKAAKKLWPDYNLIPITNGVHMPTWISPEIHHLLDKYVGENWHFPEFEVDYNKIFNIPPQELWDAHLHRKHKLIETLNNELTYKLNPDALTIAWARRLASYKRPDLILSDIDRLAAIVNNTDRPVQILLAGKAHPQDNAGKDLLQGMCKTFFKDQFRDKVVLIPGYNWQLGRRMVSGADIWLNTPYRYEEASGTSGMKAAANGVLQFTTLDGWTDEIDWKDIGWVVDEHNPATSLYDKLEGEIADLYYHHPSKPYNEKWVEMMLRSMHTVLYNYSTQRMMTDYLEKIYAPVITASGILN